MMSLAERLSTARHFVALAVASVCFLSGFLSGADVNSLVVRGTPSSDTRFFVRVFGQQTAAPRRVCGGTLITPDWVLTAAKCVYLLPATRVWTEVGDFSVEGGERTQTLVRKVIWHHLYFPNEYGDRHNIALLKLLLPRPFNHTLPLCNEPPKACALMVACGMGSVYSLEYVEPTTLREMYYVASDTLWFFQWCPLDMVCPEPLQHKRSLCVGDIGGPLYLLNEGTVEPKCLYGLASHFKDNTSMKSKCERGTYFLRAQFYSQWILNTMASN